MASAYFLSQSGWQVTLVEQGQIGRGCSYANAGLIVPSHSHPLPGPGVIRQALRWMLRKDSPLYVRPQLRPGFFSWAWQFRRFCREDAAERGFHALLGLSRAGLALHDTLAQTLLPGFVYQRGGLLHAYLSEAGAAGARGEAAALKRSGFAVRILPRDEVHAFEPALHPRVRGGLFIEGEAHGDCFGYVSAMAAAMAARGARIVTGRRVSRLCVRNGRAAVVTAEPSSEEIPGDLVVLAAGSWTPSLAATVGIRIPLEPAKGYSCTIDGYPGAPTVPVLLPEKRVIITPLGGRLRFAGTLELAGQNLTLDRTRYQAVVNGARQALRISPPLEHEEPWCGLRPVTPDGLPIIDRAPGVGNLIIATGHAMLGYTQSPITGKLVAELANGLAPSVPLEAFRLSRFQ